MTAKIRFLVTSTRTTALGIPSSLELYEGVWRQPADVTKLSVSGSTSQPPDWALEMQSRCVEAVGTFFSCLLPLLGVFVTGQIPLQLRPMKCNKRTDFNALCQSACHDILVSEFGFCGESIQFTARHYNLKELTISLGSIFNHNAREEERHWRERRSDFKRRSDVKINYTLAIIDEDYTIQYLVFFNDPVKALGTTRRCIEGGDSRPWTITNKSKKSKCGDDGTSVSSLDVMSVPDGDLTALYDYDPPVNVHWSAIVVRKGDSLWLYGRSSTGDWLDVLCRRTGERGWVPVSCLFDPTSSKPLIASGAATASSAPSAHVSCPSLIGERWYHGAIHRSYAEYLLNSGITGSFLVRESESSFGKLTLSLRSDGRIFHYRISTDENNQIFPGFFLPRFSSNNRGSSLVYYT
ncbi:Tyrosine-protein kinase abl-1 [Echinococcus granulosus]|uniref:Tyrosine-protein kinase abl-1 n=1 Tax=Echinococcus granulosus TaxID=6210 RepID=W6USA3_ECHGR|nr:Tyrosine-protein kinase abl-1 [Echinococcus granulosus]EUB64525.1 Tyrosine-protein kinase abl-1 [Echinococcus granulosus]